MFGTGDTARATAREWQSIICLSLYTGQRLGNIAALKWANVDLVRKGIRIETHKTHRALRVPIAAPLRTNVLSLPSDRRRDWGRGSLRTDRFFLCVLWCGYAEEQLN